MLQRDVYGRPMAQPCYVNSDCRYWMLRLMEDYAESYPVAGIMWGSERRGPFEATVLGGVPYCFCVHCLARARDAGIDVTLMPHYAANIVTAWLWGIIVNMQPPSGCRWVTSARLRGRDRRASLRARERT
jgi:hypothetical protein